MPRSLRALPLALLLALTVGSSALADERAGERPLPPSRAELERSTEAFLERHGRVGDSRSAPGPTKTPARFGGLFPESRVVSLYGAPQLPATILGRKSPGRAVEKLRRQSRPYRRRLDESVVKAFDLIATIATPCQSSADCCRFHQPDSLIATYLNKVRAVRGRLVLDIQPGRARVLDEVRHLREWILMPDVDVAIDPEWHVREGESPGTHDGSIGSRQLNRVSRKLQRMVATHDLPPKLMVVHQYREGSIRHRGLVRRRHDVDVTLNFDGIGSASAKRAGYRNLGTERLFGGFSLFYRLDQGLMSPGDVVRMPPPASYVMYQ